MKRILSAAAGCLLIIAIDSCKKEDNWFFGQQKRYDYVQASSKAISDAGDQELPLFTKTYDNSGKLTKVSAAFRNIAGAYYQSEEFNVRYSGSTISFIRPQGDTVASLEFNNNKKLIKAVTNLPFGTTGYQQYNYRFSYQGGKLKSIEQQDFLDNEYDPEPNPWYPYLTIAYDNGLKNVSKLTYADGSYIDYEYDYQKKAKEQFYPDEMYGDYYRFWYFLKYLNIFPEVNGENLLKRSYYNGGEDGYPSSYERQYSDHQLDGSGKLISYWQKNKWDDVPQTSEFWKIKWEYLR